MKELDIQKAHHPLYDNLYFQARNCSASVYKTVPSIGQDRMSQNEVNAFVFPTLSSADDRLW